VHAISHVSSKPPLDLLASDVIEIEHTRLYQQHCSPIATRQDLHPIMDYSASIHEDHPAGTSPWGSSPVASPQHPRTSSFGAHGDVPPSPTPYASNQSNSGFSQDDTLGGGSYQEPGSSVGEGSVTESDGQRPDTADSIRSQPEHQQAYPGQAPPQSQYQAQAHRGEPQRYHQPNRQAQQPQAPQYKLQAKITGLERTGRKDPILRFDVHVCFNISIGFSNEYANKSDQPSKVSDYPIPRRPKNSL